MEELPRSAISLDKPGRGALCYRLIESLTVGACVGGPELETELHVPLDGARIASTEADLVACCDALLRDDARTRALSVAAAMHFGRYLQLDQLGLLPYLHECLCHIRTRRSSRRM